MQGGRDSDTIFTGLEEYQSILSENFSLIRETHKTHFRKGNTAQGRQETSREGRESIAAQPRLLSLSTSKGMKLGTCDPSIAMLSCMRRTPSHYLRYRTTMPLSPLLALPRWQPRHEITSRAEVC